MTWTGEKREICGGWVGRLLFGAARRDDVPVPVVFQWARAVFVSNMLMLGGYAQKAEATETTYAQNAKSGVEELGRDDEGMIVTTSGSAPPNIQRYRRYDFLGWLYLSSGWRWSSTAQFYSSSCLVVAKMLGRHHNDDDGVDGDDDDTHQHVIWHLHPTPKCSSHCGWCTDATNNNSNNNSRWCCALKRKQAHKCCECI